jgi:hypothetical protein
MVFMSFERCPECQETNYSERIYTRSFACGFKSQFDERQALCGAQRQRPQKRTDTATFNDEAARYRLALLDAAQATDLLATDMAMGDQDKAYVARCRELARQMRTFAGHIGASARMDDAARASATASGNSALAFVHRMRRMW